jgi:4-coumarate--CoA ligase
MARSTFPDIDLPDKTVYELLFADLDDADLDRVALVDGPSGDETSYRALIAQIDALAGSLAKRGLAVGDRVGILCPNIPAFATVFHGVLRAGGTATTVNTLYMVGEIAAQLTSARAGWLFTVSPLLPQAEEAARSAGIDDAHLVVIDGAPGHPSLHDLLFERAAPPVVDIDPARHLAVLPYSSGTTGHPKGVMLTHRNLVANVLQCGEVIPLDRDDRVLAVLPFFHIYGMSVLLDFALLKRAALVTMPKFDLADFLRTVSEHRTTWVFIAPPIAVALAKHPLIDEYDLSSVEVVFSGAAPLDRSLAAAVAERLGCTVCQGYGMTETSPVTHVIPVGRDDIDRSSIGFAVPNTECRVVDPDTGREVKVPRRGKGPSAPGELLVRGPQVMAGYLDDADSTSAALEPDGWLHTGDIATVDSTGVYAIVDRLKELIKYKGYQVAPAVLEAVLLAHPHVADAAVIGVLDDDGQEVPKAFVVRRSDGLDEAAVIEWVEQRVAPHEKVRLVEFIESVPKSASGKILRKDLRARRGRHAAIG